MRQRLDMVTLGVSDLGGFHGYFADPAGFLREVAHNSEWSVEADGGVRIGPVAG